MRFEWDPAKATANRADHGVAFEEARTVFGDVLTHTIFDEAHSTPDEDRWLTMGMSDQGHLLVVWHVDLGDGEVIRIIGTRPATPRERRAYESGQSSQY